MGWLDKFLHSDKKEEPENKAGESHWENDAHPPTIADEPPSGPEHHEAADAVYEPPPQEDPFLKALERHGKDMAGALKEVCRRMDYNDAAEVCLAFIKYSYKISDEGFERLAEMESLEKLDITDAAITNVGLGHLATLPKLSALIADVTAIGDEGLTFLKEKHSLRRLSLAATQVSDVGLKHLANLTQLESLNLSGTNITQRGLIHLKGLTNLIHLDLSENEIRDDGLQNLHGLSQLQFISLNDTRVTDAGIKHLDAFEDLKYFNVKRTFVTDRQIARLIEIMPYCKFNMG